MICMKCLPVQAVEENEHLQLSVAVVVCVVFAAALCKYTFINVI